ncbi:MAG: hypothetical protein WBQ78_11170 [Gammaproteobacteria bacterium]
MHTVKLIVMLVLLAGATGCAALRPSADGASDAVAGTVTEPTGTGWWYARFSIARPDGEAPRWHIDSLLGGEVIAPMFDRNYQDIMIWRVHRRAGDDAYGHVFSFIFYSTAAAAQRIYTDLENNPVLRKLRQDGTVTGVDYDDLTTITRPRIEDTSDASWSPVVQESWPAFAMGASRMWLDMVGVIADGLADEPDLEQRYRAVQQEVDTIWASQGQHAMLHHLSAVFGYQPLLITY